MNNFACKNMVWRNPRGHALVALSGWIGAVIGLLLGGVVGWLSWGGSPDVERLVWILVLPVAWGMARSRVTASMVIAGYYLAATRGLPGGAIVFFGDTAPAWLGCALWFGACALLTSPFALAWSARRSARPWRFIGALCVSTVPPLAIIGWVSPLAVGGVIFPGLSWVGVVLTVGVLAFLVAGSWRWLAVLAVLAVVANSAIYLVGPLVPLGWQGVDTNFSQLSSAGTDDAGQLLASMKRVQWVREFAKTVPAKSVRVLPETVLGSFDGASSFALRETETALRARGSRLLVGAELPQVNGQYQNSILVLGAHGSEDVAAIQNIPVPISMWKPWATDGAVADVFGHGNLIEVNGVRAGGVVCYEQVLAYSLLWVMKDHPDVLLAVSNIWWARATSIPVIQRQTVNAFSRMFGVAVVTARNF